jgi:hypothetical protein
MLVNIMSKYNYSVDTQLFDIYKKAEDNNMNVNFIVNSKGDTIPSGIAQPWYPLFLQRFYLFPVGQDILVYLQR